jgi:hypothetical protein
MMSSIFGGSKQKKPPPIPQVPQEMKDATTSVFDLDRRRQNALAILTSGAFGGSIDQLGR